MVMVLVRVMVMVRLVVRVVRCYFCPVKPQISFGLADWLAVMLSRSQCLCLAGDILTEETQLRSTQSDCISNSSPAWRD